MHVIVIGGGISGLAAAHQLLASGARVTVVEGTSQWGGKLRSGVIAGIRTDLGAESMLARRPEGIRLAEEVGLGGLLRPPAVARAAVWTRGALRPMPQGHVMGVPSSPSALAGVLSDAGTAGIARDAELPAPQLGEDVSFGEFVAGRMGHEVVDRLVEPLLGGVYAGDVYRISMRSAVPALFAAARREANLQEAVRAVQRQATPAQPGEPVFTGLDGGIGTLPPAVVEHCRRAGATLLTGTDATALRRATDGWTITLADGRQLSANGVIVAVPAAPAAKLLAEAVPTAARELSRTEYASMALITLAYRRDDLDRLPRGSGFLVPAIDGRQIKAATFSSSKWDWAAARDPGLFVLRTSIGRYGQEALLDRDDRELTAMAKDDLREATGIGATPVDQLVTRWRHGLPQYTVGHRARVSRIRQAVSTLPGLRLCGALYEGVGIPACVAGGWRAARELLATLPSARTNGAGE